MIDGRYGVGAEMVENLTQSSCFFRCNYKSLDKEREDREEGVERWRR